MIGITRKQTACLTFLEAFIKAHGVAPSLRETAAALGCCQSNVSRLWDRLEERGHIRRLGTNSRGLEILSGDYLGFLSSDVRDFVTDYAKAHDVLPETIIAERMREWAEHEKRGAA